MEERGTSTTCRARAPPASGCTHLHVGLIVTGLGEDAGGGRVGELSLVAPAVILLQECHQVASWGEEQSLRGEAAPPERPRAPGTSPLATQFRGGCPCPGEETLPRSLLFSSLWRLLRPLALGMRSELRMALLM